MGYKLILSFTVFLLLCCCEGSLAQFLDARKTNISGEFLYELRGRDGIQGRDGRQGRDGPQGRDGTPGGPRGERGPQGVHGAPGSLSGGATYIRWGNSACPGVTDTELVYSGIAGGTFFTHGGGSNYLCLPKDPEYSSTLTYKAGIQKSATIHGSEYQYPARGTADHNVPCAVCRVSTRLTVLMITAKATCPSTWTNEYYGYLLSEKSVHRRSTFECVDRAMQSIPGSQANINGALFYHTEASCTTGLPCPPYNNHQELNCVVCTK